MEKYRGKIGGIHTKSLVPELLINPRCCKRFQTNAIAMYYGPEV